MEEGSIRSKQWVGQVLGKYRIVRKLGEGGMGAVYEAKHEQIGRRAAIKILHPELASNPQVAARFLNEARAANAVQHAGIVDVYEFGQLADGTAYIIMQYLIGESLRGRLARVGALGADGLRLGRQIASALAAAHLEKIVHRDLKPENLMIVADAEAPGGERIKVLDFGIAKLAAELKGPGEQRTRTGVLMGTPAYMAPEQCRGQTDLNDRADVYALGIIVFEMVTGVKPFQGDMGELIAAHLYQPPPVVGSAELDGLLGRMLAKTAAERPSMREVAAELERLGGSRSAMPSEVQLEAIRQSLPMLTATPVDSTLGRSTGQVGPGRPRWRNALWVGAALAVVVGVGAGGLARRPRGKVPVAVEQPKPVQPGPEPPPPPVQPPPVEVKAQMPALVVSAEPVAPKKKDKSLPHTVKQRPVGKPAAPAPAPFRAPAATLPSRPAQPAEEEYVPKLLH